LLPGTVGGSRPSFFPATENCFPGKWGGLINPHWSTGRLVLAALAVLVLGVGACTIPTSYEAEVGTTLAIHVPKGADALPSQSELLEFLQSAGPADDASVSISRQANGDADLHLMLWGQNIQKESVIERLQATYPVFEKALFEIHEHTGTVEGNLAEKIGHFVFHFELHEDDVEAMRTQILQEIREQGFDGEVDVQLHEEGGEQHIEIMMTEEE
jgi:hypothetical protein